MTTATSPTVLTDAVRAQRVAIAQDVLKWLDSPVTFLRANGYLHFNLERGDITDYKDLQDALPSLQNCEVCLLGACLLSKARLFDAVPLKNARHCLVAGLWAIDDDFIREQLDDIFDGATLSYMEHAFEGAHMYCSDDTDEEMLTRAAYWGQQRSPQEAARGVMENIIANNGELVI